MSALSIKKLLNFNPDSFLKTAIKNMAVTRYEKLEVSAAPINGNKGTRMKAKDKVTIKPIEEAMALYLNLPVPEK